MTDELRKENKQVSSDWDESGLIVFRELKMRNLFLKNIETLTLFRKETNDNFKKMSERQDKCFQLMFDVIEKFEERNKSFETRIEKMDKNIESLLKILTQKS